MVFSHRIIQFGAVLHLVVLLTACARFQVHIDVMDPEFARSELVALSNQQIIDDAVNGREAPVEDAIITLSNVYKAGLLELLEAESESLESEIEKLDTEIKALSGGDTLEGGDGGNTNASQKLASLQRKLDEVTAVNADAEREIKRTKTWKVSDFDRSFPEVRTRLASRFNSIACPNTNCAALVLDGVHANLRAARLDAIRAYKGQLTHEARLVQTTLENFADEVDRTLTGRAANEWISLRRDIINNIGSRVIRAQNQVERSSYLGDDGATLALSRLAYSAVNAPDDKWARRFNTAEGIGVGGSTNIAIKLNSTADFSIKGLVFDARATAIAARKLTTSTVQLLAAGSGMPIQTQGANDNNDTTGTVAESNESIVKSKANIAAYEVRENAYRASIKRVAFALVAAAEEVEKAANATERQAARAPVKAVFEASMPAISGSGTTNEN